MYAWAASWPTLSEAAWAVAARGAGLPARGPRRVGALLQQDPGAVVALGGHLGPGLDLGEAGAGRGVLRLRRRTTWPALPAAAALASWTSLAEG